MPIVFPYNPFDFCEIAISTLSLLILVSWAFFPFFCVSWKVCWLCFFFPFLSFKKIVLCVYVHGHACQCVYWCVHAHKWIYFSKWVVCMYVCMYKSFMCTMLYTCIFRLNMYWTYILSYVNLYAPCVLVYLTMPDDCVGGMCAWVYGRT
jgi:hypothetical protein